MPDAWAAAFSAAERSSSRRRSVSLARNGIREMLVAEGLHERVELGDRLFTLHS